MDDSGWVEYHEEQRQRREKRLPIRTAAILALEQEGFVVQKLTDYCFRINGRLDLFPIHNRWHDIQKNERGGAKDLAVFAREWVKT